MRGPGRTQLTVQALRANKPRFYSSLPQGLLSKAKSNPQHRAGNSPKHCQVCASPTKKENIILNFIKSKNMLHLFRGGTKNNQFYFSHPTKLYSCTYYFQAPHNHPSHNYEEIYFIIWYIWWLWESILQVRTSHKHEWIMW